MNMYKIIFSLKSIKIFIFISKILKFNTRFPLSFLPLTKKKVPEVNSIFYERLKFKFFQHWIFTPFFMERFSYFVVI